MPVLQADGELRRPRAPGSRADQPPVALGSITRQLPVTRAVGQIPYQGFLSGAGRLIRLYKEAQAVCEQRWLLLEHIELELVEDGDRAGELLQGSIGRYKDAHAICEEIWAFLQRTEEVIFQEADSVTERLAVIAPDLVLEKGRPRRASPNGRGNGKT
jgi:hypothetical protein